MVFDSKWDRISSATLAVFMAIDYVSGLEQAFYNRVLNSEIYFRGLILKEYFLLLMGTYYMFENLVYGIIVTNKLKLTIRIKVKV